MWDFMLMMQMNINDTNMTCIILSISLMIGVENYFATQDMIGLGLI